MKIKNAAAKILLPVMILSFLVSCASKKSGNTDIKQDTAQGTAQNSDAMDDDIPRNPYGDTDFSRPQGFDEKSQRDVMEKFNVADDYYYVLTLNADERIVNGKNDLAEKTVTEYFGYYSETDEHLNFTSLKTLKSMDFYKK